MNYNEALNYIHSLPRFKENTNLIDIKKVLAAFSNPQDNLNFIHIAGTNGKGSTAIMIQSALTISKKKTGLFISPFIIDFCERIQIDGEFISRNDLCKYTQIIKARAEKLNLQLSEFEFITCIAYKYFFDNNCDVVVLETGLGGRLDATNVIKKPLVSVITQIDIDHSEILGETIEKIAVEKCGIIKENSIVVSLDSQKDSVKEIIEKTAMNKNCKIFYNDSKNIIDKQISIKGNEFFLNNNHYSTKLLGNHQFDNAATAIRVLEILEIPKEYIIEGLRKAKLPGRIDILSENPLVIVDGAHNKNGVDALYDTLKDLEINNYNAIVCMMNDKEIESALSKILKSASKVFVTELPDNPRSVKSEQLKTICKKFNKESKIIELDNFKDYIYDDKPTIIFGSLYLASYIIKNF